VPHGPDAMPAGAPGEQRIVELVVAYVEANFSAPISLRDVARELGYSAPYLTHVFRRRTGTPVTAWIIDTRIRAAEELLRANGGTVAAVCERVGFNDVCYFSRQFARRVGLSPGRYRDAGGRRALRSGRACARPRRRRAGRRRR
jgi:AraC family transcriptional activator of pobA